jgi:antitoxin (DNA-binding transcriptional repressor) of toxin-antitoxin stability system
VKKYKANIINFKELRENAEVYIRRIERGESFLVMRRSVPIFRLTPVEIGDIETAGKKVVDFTTLKKRGAPMEEVLELVRRIDARTSRVSK